MTPKNTICLWINQNALEAATFYAATFPDSKVTAVHNAPSDYPDGKKGSLLMVEFTVLSIPYMKLQGQTHSSKLEGRLCQSALTQQDA